VISLWIARAGLDGYDLPVREGQMECVGYIEVDTQGADEIVFNGYRAANGLLALGNTRHSIKDCVVSTLGPPLVEEDARG